MSAEREREREREKQFEVACDQHGESPSHCLLTRLKLSLRILATQISHGCWIGTDPIYWLKILPPTLDRTNTAFCSRSSKQYTLNLVATGSEVHLGQCASNIQNFIRVVLALANVIIKIKFSLSFMISETD